MQKVWGISDLHLPGDVGKSMDKFGENWIGHQDRIAANWKGKISSGDLVFMPGDLSWANNWDGALDDIKYMRSLPGHKVIVKGNHDYFLSENHKCKEKFKKMDDETSVIEFLYNSSTVIKTENHGKIGIFGTRGWNMSDYNHETNNEKICDRELNRLELSYNTLKDNIDDLNHLVAMFHYPPTNKVFSTFQSEDSSNDTGYKEIYDERFFQFLLDKDVDTVIFGHLHKIELDYHQKIENIDLYCVSADIINFNPVEIWK